MKQALVTGSGSVEMDYCCISWVYMIKIFKQYLPHSYRCFEINNESNLLTFSIWKALFPVHGKHTQRYVMEIKVFFLTKTGRRSFSLWMITLWSLSVTKYDKGRESIRHVATALTCEQKFLHCQFPRKLFSYFVTLPNIISLMLIFKLVLSTITLVFWHWLSCK